MLQVGARARGVRRTASSSGLRVACVRHHHVTPCGVPPPQAVGLGAAAALAHREAEGLTRHLAATRDRLLERLRADVAPKEQVRAPTDRHGRPALSAALVWLCRQASAKLGGSHAEPAGWRPGARDLPTWLPCLSPCPPPRSTSCA